jgi:copper resistance protein C
LAIAFAAVPCAAFAHAYLAQSAPAADATVAAPAEVSLTFSQTLDKNFSNVEVQDDGGHRVDDGEQGSDRGPTVLAVACRNCRPDATR